MATGDLIYVPTASNGIGYVNAGTALAYKREPDPTYGTVVGWDGGDLWDRSATLYVDGTEPEGSALVFTSTTECDVNQLDIATNEWYHYVLPIPGSPDYDSNSRMQCGWNGASQAEVRIYLNATLQSRYIMTGATIPTKWGGAQVGEYTYESGLDIGTVTVS